MSGGLLSIKHPDIASESHTSKLCHFSCFVLNYLLNLDASERGDGSCYPPCFCCCCCCDFCNKNTPTMDLMKSNPTILPHVIIVKEASVAIVMFLPIPIPTPIDTTLNPPFSYNFDQVL